MGSENVLDVMAERLGVSPEDTRSGVRRRVLRVMEYRGIVYVSFRKDFQGYREGSIFLYDPASKESLFIPGYPSIRRVALLSVAVPKWFIDRVVVEEKLDGYNVRVTVFSGRLLAITRGGLVCPYTSSRLDRVLGKTLRGFFEEYNPSDYFLAGEVIGLENPYTRYFYPEAPRFGYFVFDVFYRGSPMPVGERDKLLEEHGVPRVPVLGVFDKNDVEGIREAVLGLEAKGREGVVLKDPYYRVAPLKYTTSAANIGDLELGMRFFFEEGRSFLFSRILREIFKAYEEGLDEKALRDKAERLGYAILAPAVETVRAVSKGSSVYEEFQLEFADRGEMEEFIDYMDSLGVDLVVVKVFEREGRLVAVIRKMKDTWMTVRHILETGLSPLD